MRSAQTCPNSTASPTSTAHALDSSKRSPGLITCGHTLFDGPRPDTDSYDHRALATSNVTTPKLPKLR